MPWRGEKGAGPYADVPGLCKSATAAEIATHGYVLTPGRFVGAEDIEKVWKERAAAKEAAGNGNGSPVAGKLAAAK